ncbi:hypothetical protein J2S43_005954 [Catenuloplanes nepalensis]|uniref:DUF3105 domain-containing protein n=1 Tax=Catenuloplanes nepalensis TaxID=587533 RepID=A0ABT9N159_9ACTN|nr:DUF3105 domain-containing protein [Catenuloplanes nepalensis]MDP9797442.1 hypothetical protein [Catenuloplanes nepalensis]
MSISTQGGPERRPSVVKPAAGAKPTSPGGGKPSRSGGGKGPRKPITPVKVAQQRSWGPILMFVAVGALAVGIIGYGAFAVIKGSESWEDRAAGIDGITNYRETDPGMLTANHKTGPQTYKTTPPVGGDHNAAWQNCMGDVYDAPIANEHAVHSMEHGAVWITYKTGLPQDQIDTLASKVRGNEFMLMSPIDGLSNNISVQAWGYQLKVDTADDDRIDSFIRALRINATQEPNAGCSSGVTATGTTPRDLGNGTQQGS